MYIFTFLSNINTVLKAVVLKMQCIVPINDDISTGYLLHVTE